MIKIEKLSRRHKREEFDCGNPFLNTFLRKYAYQNQNRYFVGTTYVIADTEEKVLAYITLSISSIKKETVEKNKPYEELPVLLIARAAVDKKFQNMGFGKLLLKFALESAIDLSEKLGCVGIVVDSKPEAIDFYKKFGFQEIKTVTTNYTTKLFLPIKAVMMLYRKKS